jgi:hypothetical protein
MSFRSFTCQLILNKISFWLDWLDHLREKVLERHLQQWRTTLMNIFQSCWKVARKRLEKRHLHSLFAPLDSYFRSILAPKNGGPRFKNLLQNLSRNPASVTCFEDPCFLLLPPKGLTKVAPNTASRHQKNGLVTWFRLTKTCLSLSSKMNSSTIA